MSLPPSSSPRPRRAHALAALCLLGLAAPAYLAFRPYASEGTGKEAPAPLPPASSALSTATSPASQAQATQEQPGLWQAFELARRSIQALTPEEATLPGNEGVTAFSYHPAQGLSARYANDGVRISGESGTWQARFHYTAPSSSTPWQSSGTRAEINHGDGVTEWFENRSEGLEHGFIVNHPQSTASEILRIDIHLDGLTATASDDPESLALLTNDGNPKLKYSGLKVWDANGTALTASMSPSADGIAIQVDDRGASYPITIDPLITSLEQTLQRLPTGTGSSGDFFGVSVAMDGNIAMIGALNDTTAGGAASGAVYVFEQENGQWIQKTILAPDAGSAGSAFGSIMALSGNTVVMGIPTEDRPGQTLDSGSVYVFVRSGAGWTKQAKILDPTVLSSQNFGRMVEVDGSTLAISASDPANNNRGAIYIYTRTGTTWSIQQVLREQDGTFDYYNLGRSLALNGDTLAAGESGGSNGLVKIFTRSGVTWTLRTKIESGRVLGDTGYAASIALSGNTLLIGSYQEPGDLFRTGAAYFYTGSGATWTLQTKVVPADGLSEERFGLGVALEGDLALIGRPGTRVSGINFAGSLSVYRRSGGTWTFASQALPQTPISNLSFGAASAISGGRVIIGLGRTTTDAGSTAGVANLYSVSDGNLVLQGQLTAGVEAANQHFGYAVAVEDNTVVIGAPDETTVGGSKSGRAYVFARSPGGWAEQASLTASESGTTNYNFGKALAISGDTLMVGASGFAYALVRNGSTWTHQEKIYPDASTGGFGNSVALEGNTAVIGAPAGGNGYGSAYVFTRSGVLWDQRAVLEEDQRRALAYFGTSVAIDAGTILVGTPQTGLHPGVAHVFTGSGGTWTRQATLEGEGDLRFGTSVALSGNLALVGAPGSETLPDPLPASGTGAAHLFARSGDTWNRVNRFTPDNASAVHRFGKSVAMDGSLALVGAEERYTDGPDSDGATYVYARQGVTWSFQDFIAGVPQGASASALALSGGTAVVASANEDSVNPFNGLPVTDTGSVKIYNLSGFLVSGPESMLLAAFDADGNGSLSPAEWLALYPATPKKEKLFTLVDSDQSGEVTLAEFIASLSNKVTARSTGSWTSRAKVFLELDADHDSLVTRTEIALMYPAGGPDAPIDAFWARVQGGSGLDLKTWVRTKVLPNFATYEVAKETRARRAAAAADLDLDSNGLITRTEFAALFPANAAAKKIDAAWRAACGTLRNQVPPVAITIQGFIEAPKLPPLPN